MSKELTHTRIAVSISMSRDIDHDVLHGNHVFFVNADLVGHFYDEDREDDEEEERVLAHLECFFIDLIGADEDDDTLFEECDQDGETHEFNAFLFPNDTVRGKVLGGDDDDDCVLSNILCVNGGWASSPDDVVSILIRLKRALDFDFICVDALHIRTSEPKDGKGWRDMDPSEPMTLPFKKFVWGEMAPEDGPANPSRWFYVDEAPRDPLSVYGPGSRGLANPVGTA